MRQHIEQSDIAEWHRRTLVLPELQVVDTCRKIRAAYHVEPLLHLIFILEASITTLALSRKKHVKVKLIKFALLCHLLYLVGHAIGQHHHARKRPIRIVATLPLCLGSLLIAISPVEYLVLYKLAIIDSSERCTRKEQIVACRNRQPCLIDGIVGLIFLILFSIKIDCILLVLLLKQLLGTLSPCSEMILIKYHQVPLRSVYKLILGLYTAIFACTEQVLKRTKHYYRSRLVGSLKLLVDVEIVVACIFIGDVLPALEVHVSHEVLPPCRLHSRLKRQHQHSLKAHLLSQLIARKRLAETHLGIP